MLVKRGVNRRVRNMSLFIFSVLSCISFLTFGQKKSCSELIGSITKKGSLELKYQAISCIEFSCLAIDSLFTTDSLTIDQAKIITNLLTQRNCTSSKTYLKCNELILTKEPTFNSLYKQAKIYADLDSINKAYIFYARAEKMARLSEQKSDCFLGIAKLLEKQKQYEKAKEFGELASEMNPLNQESFVFLAQLFEKAITLCNFKSELELCGVYLMTAKLYAKARLERLKNDCIKKSRIDVLTKAEVIKSNQTIKIGCFVHKEIELRK